MDIVYFHVFHENMLFLSILMNSVDSRSPGYTLIRKSWAKVGPTPAPGGRCWPNLGQTFTDKGIPRAARIHRIHQN